MSTNYFTNFLDNSITLLITLITVVKCLCTNTLQTLQGLVLNMNDLVIYKDFIGLDKVYL